MSISNRHQLAIFHLLQHHQRFLSDHFDECQPCNVKTSTYSTCAFFERGRTVRWFCQVWTLPFLTGLASLRTAVDLSIAGVVQLSNKGDAKGIMSHTRGAGSPASMHRYQVGSEASRTTPRRDNVQTRVVITSLRSPRSFRTNGVRLSNDQTSKRATPKSHRRKRKKES